MTKRSSGLTAKPLSSERSAGTSTWDRLNATITLLNIIDLLTVTIINICPTIWLFLNDLLCKLRRDNCWQMSTKSTAYRRTYSQNILCKKKKNRTTHKLITTDKRRWFFHTLASRIYWPVTHLHGPCFIQQLFCVTSALKSNHGKKYIWTLWKIITENTLPTFSCYFARLMH